VSRSEAAIEPHVQVGDLCLPQPLAVLNDEELHWQSGVGLPIQRRWLNHRTIGDGPRRKLPSAMADTITA